LNEHLSQLVEQYDQETILLQRLRAQLAAARQQADEAAARAAVAQAALDAKARAAYEGSGLAGLAAVLETSSMGNLNDGVQFLSTLEQQDADAATRAQVARRQALDAAAKLRTLVTKQATLLDRLSAEKTSILGAVRSQRALVSSIERRIHRAVLLAASTHPKVASPSASGGASGSGSGPASPPSPGHSPPPPPPPPGSGAAVAVQAARSVLGVPYHFGGASPKTGFDCSGLTMWSWAQAGVALPHSAAMQYAMLPHVPTSDLEPGDLVFFYQPISHVGIYIGGGQMIDAPYTGTFVRIDPIYWSVYSGAGRP
jgi:cell wall-associated NlpC family hydrolase